LDYDGDLFVVEEKNNNLRKFEFKQNFDSSNNIPPAIAKETVSIAGSKTGNAGFMDGSYIESLDSTTGSYSNMKYIAVDSDNNLYITANNGVRKVTKTFLNPETGFINKLYHTTTTLAGNNTAGYKDNIRGSALFNTPNGICIDLEDNIYVADTINSVIRRVALDGKTYTIAGLSNVAGNADGVNDNARFNLPMGMCCDFDGNIYVADSGNFLIRKITKSNTTTKKTFGYQLGNQVDREFAGDLFGYASAMNAAGDVIAVGAYLNSPTSTNRNGSVRWYNYNGVKWNQIGTDIDGETANDMSGYSVSLNAAGNILAIGAPKNSVGGSKVEAGTVKVYSYNGITRTQLGADIDGEAANDWSGYSVSLNAAGDRIAIGAVFNDGNGSNSGSVRIYSYNGTAWTKLGQDIDGQAVDDYFGCSVSMNAAGDRVAIGSYKGTGYVKVYTYNGTNWTQLGTNINGQATDEEFGISVSMNAAGDRVVIGAHFNDAIPNNSGSVRVYSYNGTAWVQLGADINGDASGNQFGCSVSMNAAGNRVAIGARSRQNVTITTAGAAYLYEYNGTSWVKLASVFGETASDFLGTSVAINDAGDKILAGASSSNPSGNGYAKVFSIFDEDVYDYTVSTLAGSTQGDTEGNYLAAKFGNLSDIKMMPNGDLLVGDSTARKIKRIKNTTGYKTTFNITLSSHRRNLDLGKLLLRRGWDGSSPVNCTLTILSGVYVYSQSTSYSSIPALRIPDYLQGSTITVINSGGIIGAGGNAYDVVKQASGANLSSGTDAIMTRANITLYNHGVIGGGGGAGGCSIATMFNNILTTARVGGGGGAGVYEGIGRHSTTAEYGTNGSILTGGIAATTLTKNGFTYNGGKGGDLGMDGAAASSTDTKAILYGASAGGKAIDGISFVIIHPSSTGSLSGATIN
jgi:hypothetical protein